MRKPRSWFGLIALAGLPVLVLPIYALLGLKAERRATIAGAYEERGAWCR